MVILLRILLLTTALSAIAETQAPVRLMMDVSKKEMYVGEQFTVQFLLIAPVPMVEVEVAKFPEFRGYWSENLSLRQGPLGLSPLRDGSFVGIVGSYLLSSMVGAPNPQIEPMKLLVKMTLAHPGVPPQQYLFNEAPAIHLKPLPPIPPSLASVPFNGAVGRFNIYPNALQIPFRVSDPSTARISLQGEGNFPEINELPVNFPAPLQILSQRSMTQGGGSFVSKTFEISVSSKELVDIQIPPKPFLYFDPKFGRYESLLLPSIHWIADTTPIASRDEAMEPFSLPAPKETFSGRISLTRQIIFWWPQLFLFTLLAGYFALLGVRRFKRYWDTRPRSVWKKRVQSASLLAASDVPLFLQEADRIAGDILKSSVRSSLGPSSRAILSRKTLVENVEKKHGLETARSAERIFTAYQMYAYSSLKSLPSDVSTLAKDLHFVWNRAA